MNSKRMIARLLKQEHPEAYEWVKKYADKKTSSIGVSLPLLQGEEMDAKKMMEQQIRSLVEETDDPLLKQQWQKMLDSLSN